MSRIRTLVRDEWLTLAQCAKLAGITYDGMLGRYKDDLRGEDLIANTNDGSGDKLRKLVSDERREREQAKRVRLRAERDQLLKLPLGAQS